MPTHKGNEPTVIVRKTGVESDLVEQWRWAVSFAALTFERQDKWANVSNLCRKKVLLPNLWRGNV